jgi:hypothetical protein
VSDGGAVSEVDLVTGVAPACLLDAALYLAARWLEVRADGGDVGAGFGERGRDGQPDSAPGAGYDRVLAGEVEQWAAGRWHLLPYRYGLAGVSVTPGSR